MIREPSWAHGRMTVTWYLETQNSRMGVVRFHTEDSKIPGPYDGVATVLIEDNEFEMLGYLTLPPPSRHEHKHLYKYLSSFGQRKKHDRAK